MPDHERLRDPNAMHIAIDKTQTRMGLALMSVVSRIIIDNRTVTEPRAPASGLRTPSETQPGLVLHQLGQLAQARTQFVARLLHLIGVVDHSRCKEDDQLGPVMIVGLVPE